LIIDLDDVHRLIQPMGRKELELLQGKLASALAIVVISIESLPAPRLFVVQNISVEGHSTCELNHSDDDSDT